MQGFNCRVCGQYHDEVPLSYRAEAPALWYELTVEARQHRAQLSMDTCVVDNQFFFVLGNIEIPIIASDQTFTWTVWASLSQPNFERAIRLWNQPEREHEPPYFGWLSTSLAVYPETLNLKTHVHTGKVGQRFTIELEPTEHPLALEQRHGVTLERIHRLAEIILHP